jgi:phosphoribosylaminoimidazole-succinocarboxamide synthase
MKRVALELFRFGQETAEAKGLILVDTKYEFGLDEQNNLVLIDELHTPDSCRYWLLDTYQQKTDNGEEPDNYDKEYLRLWFKERFDPYKDTTAPTVPDEVCSELTNRYTYVYEHLTGQKFVPAPGADPVARIEANIRKALERR